MKFAVSMVDLTSNLLFVYLTLTALAFQSMVDGQERALPDVALARASGTARGAAPGATLTLSAKRSESGGVRYFVNDATVAWDALPAALKAAGASAVVLRIGEDLPMQTAIQVMVLLESLGIRNVTFAYRAE
jgi:biopolymer transport protein ExbD